MKCYLQFTVVHVAYNIIHGSYVILYLVNIFLAVRSSRLCAEVERTGGGCGLADGKDGG